MKYVKVVGLAVLVVGFWLCPFAAIGQELKQPNIGEEHVCEACIKKATAKAKGRAIHYKAQPCRKCGSNPGPCCNRFHVSAMYCPDCAEKESVCAVCLKKIGKAAEQEKDFQQRLSKLIEQLEDKDEKKRAEAEAELKKLGGAVLEGLEKELKNLEEIEKVARFTEEGLKDHRALKERVKNLANEIRAELEKQVSELLKKLTSGGREEYVEATEKLVKLGRLGKSAKQIVRAGVEAELKRAREAALKGGNPKDERDAQTAAWRCQHLLLVDLDRGEISEQDKQLILEGSCHCEKRTADWQEGGVCGRCGEAIDQRDKLCSMCADHLDVCPSCRRKR